jgi:predicted permease
MYVFNSLAPVFGIIGLGVLLRWVGFLTPEFVRGMTRLAYRVGIPCLLFQKLATAGVDVGQHADAIVVQWLGTGLCMVVGYAMARWVGAPRASIGTTVQMSYHGNLAFVGLSVILYSTSHDVATVVATAVLIIACVAPLYNISSVAVLLAPQHQLSAGALRAGVWQRVTNPVILACLAGGAYAYADLPLPAAADRTLAAIGQMALPVALLGIGGSLRLERSPGRYGMMLAASLVKVGFGPAVGFALGRLAGLSGDELRVVVLLFACPNATVAFILADQLGGDRALAAGAVVMSTLLSIASLSVVVWAFG